MSLSEVPPLRRQLDRESKLPSSSGMAPKDEEGEDPMSDSEDMPYIKCEAVYGEDDDDDMSALPFVRTEMRVEDDEGEHMKFGMKTPEVGAYVKCSVPSCHSYFEVGNPKYEGFSHFKFPEDPPLRRRWINIIGQKEDWEPEGAMICSNHFPNGSFVNVVECIETGQLLTKRTLKAGALPTMNLLLPPSWNLKRVVLPSTPNVAPIAPAAPIARSIAPAPPAPTAPTIRSPYCQGRAITLTKNGKRRGRPPKNRPSEDFSAQVYKMESPSTSQLNGAGSPSNPFGLNKQLPPFQILGMGKRKRGRPRKEVSVTSGTSGSALSIESAKESLLRLAESQMAQRANWRKSSTQSKMRNVSMQPERLPQTVERRRRLVQLQANVDSSNLPKQPTGGSGQPTARDRGYFESLAVQVVDLSAASQAELRRVIESTLERLRKADRGGGGRTEDVEEPKGKRIKSEAKDVKIPHWVSIKPVGAKGAGPETSAPTEEELPALTITIRREGQSGQQPVENGDEEGNTPEAPPAVTAAAQENGAGYVKLEVDSADEAPATAVQANGPVHIKLEVDLADEPPEHEESEQENGSRDIKLELDSADEAPATAMQENGDSHSRADTNGNNVITSSDESPADEDPAKANDNSPPPSSEDELQVPTTTAPADS